MGILIWLILVEALYVRALRVLGRRGVAVPRGQVACWHLGLGLQAVALLSPLGALADELLTAHMAEHLLMADLGAPLLLAGLRNPVLAFFLPREVLVPLARRRRLRKVFRTLRQPLVAIPVYFAARMLGMFLGMSFVLIRPPVYTGVYDPVERRGMSALADQQAAGAIMVAL